MTEIEAMSVLHYLLGCENAVDAGEIDEHNCLNSQEKEALKFILEEIQQYRAIGFTPKMVKEMIESEKLASHQAIIRGVKLEQYEAIGTIEEFKVLKDAEEQGLLLRLPCKVGDTLYFIYHNSVCHSEVKRFFQCNGAKNWGIVLWDMYPDLYFDQIGKTVFLTQEEAEQILAEGSRNDKSRDIEDSQADSV